MSIARFSHGPDGLWQDPEGLYVEFADYERLRQDLDRLLARLRDFRPALARGNVSVYPLYELAEEIEEKGASK